MIRFEVRAHKDMRRLAPQDRARVTQYLRKRVLAQEHPGKLGSPLMGTLSEFWRYRVGDMRVICRIDDGKLIVLVINVGDRREIYR